MAETSVSIRGLADDVAAVRARTVSIEEKLDAVSKMLGGLIFGPVTANHFIHSIRVLRDPESLPPAPSASLLALQDISRRMRALATHEQVDRVVNGMVEYFLAGCCEAVSFSRKTPDGGRLHSHARLDELFAFRVLCVY